MSSLTQVVFSPCGCHLLEPATYLRLVGMLAPFLRLMFRVVLAEELHPPKTTPCVGPAWPEAA